jgi:hypothetical protein
LYPFHTSVMMSITQFLSPVLQCEATIVKILHTLSAPSFLLKPDASQVTKMKMVRRNTFVSFTQHSALLVSEGTHKNQDNIHWR